MGMEVGCGSGAKGLSDRCTEAGAQEAFMHFGAAVCKYRVGMYGYWMC